MNQPDTKLCFILYAFQRDHQATTTPSTIKQRRDRGIMHLKAIITFLLLACGSGIDILERGKRVIMQRDVDHLLARLDLKHIDKSIKQLHYSVTQARVTLIQNAIGMSKNDKELQKLSNMIQATLGKVQLRSKILESLFEENIDFKGKGSKRAIEFLGNVISSITGVPSPREHRQVLEKLRLVNLDRAEMEQIIGKSTQVNRAILQVCIYMMRVLLSNQAK